MNLFALFNVGRDIKRCAQFWLKLTWHVHIKYIENTEFQNVILVVKSSVILKCACWRIRKRRLSNWQHDCFRKKLLHWWKYASSFHSSFPHLNHAPSIQNAQKSDYRNWSHHYKCLQNLLIWGRSYWTIATSIIIWSKAYISPHNGLNSTEHRISNTNIADYYIYNLNVKLRN